MKPELSLRDVLRFYLDRQINMRAGSALQLKATVSVLDRQLKGGVTLEHCTSEFLCEWLRACLNTRAKRTVKGYRANILTLLRFALSEQLIDELPRLPTIRVERKNPTAWTLEEVSRILQTAFNLDGKMRDLPITRAWWFGTLLLFLYDTGARVRSALSLKCKDVLLDRGVAILSADHDKTWSDRVVPLSPELVLLFRDGLSTKRQLVWPWPWAKRELWRHVANIQRAAGLPTGRMFGFHRMRRTHATQAVISAGWAAAQRSLGHSSPAMTEAYVDRSQVNEECRIALPRPAIDYTTV